MSNTICLVPIMPDSTTIISLIAGSLAESLSQDGRSMAEMAMTREHHCQTVLVRGGYDFLIADGPARLHHGCGASDRHGIEAVAEWKKGIRSRRRSAKRIGPDRVCFHARDPYCVYTAHLSGSDGERPIGRGEKNGIGLNVRTHSPGKPQCLPFFRCRCTLCDHFQTIAAVPGGVRLAYDVTSLH